MSGQGASKEISLTFAKGLEVFSAFDGADRDLTIAEVSRKTQLNRTVVRRLVLTLHSLGYVESTGQSGYQLTPKVLQLAGAFLQGREFGKRVAPVLRSFSQRLGEGISFAMLSDLEAIYVAYSAGDSSMITDGFTVGYRLPLSATAIGRTLVAFSPKEVQQYILENAPRTRYTEKTKIGDPELEDAFQLSRKCGFTLVTDEFEIGVTSLAVPVFKEDLQLGGALGIVGPTPRFASSDKQKNRIEILKSCADAVAVVV